MKLPLLEKAEVCGQRVFMRADLDVPLRRLKLPTIKDETRLLAWMPTLKFLLDNGAKVTIAGHLGRPKGFDGGLSLEPIAQWLCKKLKVENGKLKIAKIKDLEGWELSPRLFLLENLRFYEGEEKNDIGFAKKLASLENIYVNDAFAVCHRNHASVVSVPRYLLHFAGLRLQKETEVLGSVLENPKRPLVVIIGGAKIETKLPLVKQMYKFADYILVGGKIAREFDKGKHASLIIAELNDDKTDITDKSVKMFLQIIRRAQTVVWNGPIGKILNKNTEKGTRQIAKAISTSSAFTVVGGGDTVGFLRKIHLINTFSFVSTGGGAMLAFLSKKNMPGLEALIAPNK